MAGVPKKLKQWTAITIGILVMAAVGVWGVQVWSTAAEKREAIAMASTRGVEAIPAVERCLERSPDDPALLKTLVALKMKANASLVEIEPLVERWVVSSPGSVEALQAQIEVLSLLGRYDDALASAERVAELSPDLEEARSTRARLYLKIGRWDDAAKLYASMTAVKPTTDSLIGLARAELERGRLVEAAAALDQVVQQDPRSSEARILRAYVEYQTGNYQSALARFRNSPGTDLKEREFALYYVGQCLDRLGQTGEAMRVYKEMHAIQDAIRFAEDARQRPDDESLQHRAKEALNKARLLAEDVKRVP